MLMLNSSSTEEGDVNLNVQNIKHDFFFLRFYRHWWAKSFELNFGILECELIFLKEMA